METASTPCKVHQCSKCPGDTEYYCVSCPCDLCPQCKENHVKDLQTIDHDVVSYRDKINYIPTQEICVRHPSHVYIKYCEPCQVPVCNSCSEDQSHRFRSFLFGQGQHEILDIQVAYKTKRQQHRGTIHTISDAIFNRPVLLPRIKTDFKTCRTEFSRYQSEMLTKVQTLKHLINKVRKDFMCNVFCDFDFKHRCLKQKKEMIIHIVCLQEYELRYVQPKFTFSALQFLSSIKTALPQIHPTLHTSQLSMTESLNKEDVMESLSAIQITERGNRRVGNQCLLKLTYASELHQSLTVTGVGRCFHISCVTSDRVWVSDVRKNLILTDTTGVPPHRVEDSCSGYGLHTVNSEGELIYIDRNYNINKLSKDMKTTTTFLKRTDFTWNPRCVYWSPSTGDLLVGMRYRYTKIGTKVTRMRYIHRLRETGKVTRYNQSGQLTQTIQHNNKGWGQRPRYITENNNGDVVVSDYGEDYEDDYRFGSGEFDDDFDVYNIYMSGAVVVTERGGRHRFSYTGPSSGSGLRPCGICTDALSHILVCDDRTDTVQMLDKDGQFLSYLLTKSQEMGRPWGLSYDVNTHRLWVGSGDNNKVCVYRYITRQDALTDQSRMMESLSGIPTPGTEKPQQGNQCLLKLMSPPELLHSLTVTGVDHCYHISCVTSDRVWVSEIENNLILTDTTGVPLHRVEDSWSGLYNGGLHTVNRESELIYIDRNYNINKLSKGMKTTTTFLKRTDSTWKPQCVYWSPSTGDLLVGMCYRHTDTGKVTRYNQSGQLTQTIQHDNTGRGLYSIPRYITENNNGDVVVSDWLSGVVVTERGGKHRYSYTGPPSGSVLQPCGICTDALSHILVCDSKTNTVQMLDKDGQFLSHLLTKSQEMGVPWSLSYDVNTHRLWVGSYNNKVCVYRCITRQDALTDQSRVMESLSGIPTPGTEKPQQGNQCLLKLMSPPELLHSLTVTGVDCCHHISCVTSDRVWVSDRDNLMLTDTTGVPLHRVEDSCSDLYIGLHTVNSESELIYIDRNDNINKLSKDMKTTTTFIERTDSTWRPQCVYWSPSTGGLLVGMFYIYIQTGKVTRYNQSGQLTQTIQHDNTGRGLYSRPCYITENNNGDVVVSDYDDGYESGAVVVAERGGRHRFSYTGHPLGSGQDPCGICTDALSHILVCDDRTKTVQMLDKDGQFLSHLLTESQEMGVPCSLSYDVSTHRLWVGSWDNNKVCVYRYITRQDALTDEHRPRPDEEAMFSSTSAVEWR
ncbi:uncharacterized protein LOC128162486 [Crassostrea angulata]|uniref:uncharacterized protein LOC128162486 n=1 Tax=Magallana angulata TaxID=2784310 RepID=UPI0022B0DFC1|nr:uncharacterized protein LOC128162486 [Crassostrea angulata]